MGAKRKKVAEIMGYIYGTGILLAFLAGTLSVVGYVVAFAIGGTTATEICVFIYKEFYPILFSFSSIVVLFGLVKMYVAGEKSLVPKRKDEKKTENCENVTKDS